MRGSRPIFLPCAPPPLLRRAITGDKSLRMEPLPSVRGCQNIFIPPKDPGNHRCQTLCCIGTPDQGFVFFFKTQVCTGDLSVCTVPGGLLSCQKSRGCKWWIKNLLWIKELSIAVKTQHTRTIFGQSQSNTSLALGKLPLAR